MFSLVRDSLLLGIQPVQHNTIAPYNWKTFRHIHVHEPTGTLGIKKCGKHDMVIIVFQEQFTPHACTSKPQRKANKGVYVYSACSQMQWLQPRLTYATCVHVVTQ